MMRVYGPIITQDIKKHEHMVNTTLSEYFEADSKDNSSRMSRNSFIKPSYRPSMSNSKNIEMLEAQRFLKDHSCDARVANTKTNNIQE